MRLQHIDIKDLKLSPLNVRKHGGGDINELVTSIKHLGVLQPLLVRQNCQAYEVIAGQRRLKACRRIAEQDETFTQAPCAVMEDGEDADAIEASLAENVARLPMDELDQYEAFAGLIKRDRSVEQIASGFGVSERLVRQRLAIANLLPPILTLCRKEEISGETMRALTLATKPQQKAWLARFRDPEDHAPQGRHLRQWLFGGEQIATAAALFPLEAYQGVIVADLFGEGAYFADPAAFWALQIKAIAEAADAYRARGWADVVMLQKGDYWQSYEYRRTAKKDGGKVYVAVMHGGAVSFHEGFLPEKEARRRGAGQERSGEATASQGSRPELTKPALNYVDLHRHAAVRAALIGEAGVALRLMVAHAIAGSSLWRVAAEPQRADKPETAQSLAASRAEAVFTEERNAVLSMLGLDADSSALVACADIHAVFDVLLSLDDDAVLRVLACVMAESLSVGGKLIDTLGVRLGVDMSACWQTDDAFLSLIRDREVLNAMLAEIGGKPVADAHAASPAKTIRNVIRQYTTGEGRPKVEGWIPRYMQFPANSYVERPGLPPASA